MASDSLEAAADGVLMRRSRAKLLLGASPFLIAAGFATLVIAVGVYPLLALLVHMMILGMFGVSWAARSLDGLVDLEGAIGGDERGLLRNGAVLVPHEDLRQGFVMPYGPFALVRLERRGALAPSIVIRVPSVERGRALLRSLGLDATQHVARIRAASWLLTQSVGKQLGLTLGPMAVFAPIMIGLAALLGKHGGYAVMGLAPLLVAYLLGISMAPTVVRIGTDGFVTKWLTKEELVPFSDVQSIEPYEQASGGKHYVGVIVERASGDRLKLCAGQKEFLGGEQGTLLERLREALEAHKSGAHAADTTKLARRGRSTTDWIAHLRRMGAGADADLRRAGMSLEALVAAVNDTALDAPSRASAAVAAMPYATPAEKQRIRIAANTTASPKLRVALDAITSADADDTKIAEALDELAATEETREPADA